jgi:GTP-binding protein Era
MSDSPKKLPRAPAPRGLRRPSSARPTPGKSTLVNRLVGAKVSIVTQKVQTTRFPVRGVAIEGDAQIVLVDTPGIFKPRRRLDRAMVRSAWTGAQEAEAVVHWSMCRQIGRARRRAAAPADRKAVGDVEQHRRA